ncbi:MAG: BolA/IbaG family iron-sulfur metabolism protein [Halobacteriovoraceae bacterium]|nr:BolA/IbaG family iron-sulfur metabolism protein [Halobacteriovoraceae bacterium]MCB9094078.1 BolA/IbaG family iron-sulfur metabolism protein [Halobacteriovoraceae bacterium]
MSLTEKIRSLLSENFPNSEVEVGPMRGASDDHLEICITSAKFNNLTLLEQHQMVMGVLKQEFQDALHAIRLKTLKKEES